MTDTARKGVSDTYPTQRQACVQLEAREDARVTAQIKYVADLVQM